MEGGQRLGKKMSQFFAGRLMYRSNRTPEIENFTEISSAMHFGSDAAVHVMGGGGGLGTGFQCYWLALFEISNYRVTVYMGIIFDYQIFEIQ